MLRGLNAARPDRYVVDEDGREIREPLEHPGMEWIEDVADEVARDLDGTARDLSSSSASSILVDAGLSREEATDRLARDVERHCLLLIS